MMQELVGHKIIRVDTQNNGNDELTSVIMILDNRQRVTFGVIGTGAFDSELDVTID